MLYYSIIIAMKQATTDLVRPDKFSVSQIKVYYDPHHSDLKADTLDEDILQ